MIPAPIPPLTGLSVLVTRPQPQADQLCQRIALAGGEPIAFPAIAITPFELALSETLPADSPAPHDIVIFVSVNAVRHGLSQVQRGPATRFVAIGPATAAALAAAGAAVDLSPTTGFDSESLLAEMQPLLASEWSSPGVPRVLIVRGAGGRVLLQEEIARLGGQVEYLEVYRRAFPDVAATTLQSLEDFWLEAGMGVVTATSVETLQNLLQLLPDSLREPLWSTPLLCVSERISQAARALGWRGECFVAGGPDEDSILGALATWHARARAQCR